MTVDAQYTPVGPAQLNQFWSAHVDALERHLSVNTWALTALSLLLIGYPIARMVMPVFALHGIVPVIVRNVLHLI